MEKIYKKKSLWGWDKIWSFYTRAKPHRNNKISEKFFFKTCLKLFQEKKKYVQKSFAT